MKITKVEDVFVLGYETLDEAQAALDAEHAASSATTDTVEVSITERFEQVWDHLKARGIDASQPVPAAAEEVPAPEGTSHAVETIVPTKTPVAYVPIPRQALAAPSGPGEDKPVEVHEPAPEAPPQPEEEKPKEVV